MTSAQPDPAGRLLVRPRGAVRACLFFGVAVDYSQVIPAEIFAVKFKDCAKGPGALFSNGVRAGAPSRTNQKATPRGRVAIWLDGDGGLGGGGVLGGRQRFLKRTGVRPPIGQRKKTDAGTRQDRPRQMRVPKAMVQHTTGGKL